MNILLLGYSGCDIERTTEGLSSTYGLRALVQSKLDQVYRDLVFSSPNGKKVPEDNLEKILGILSACQGSHFVMANVPKTEKHPNTKENLGRIVCSLKSWGKGIDYAFVLKVPLELVLLRNSNGDPRERMMMREMLLDERKDFRKVIDYVRKNVPNRYTILNEDLDFGLGGHIVNVIEHRDPLEL